MNDLTHIKIEDRVYTLRKFSPGDGMEFASQVFDLLAPSLDGLIEAAKNKGDTVKNGLALLSAFKGSSTIPFLRRASKPVPHPSRRFSGR